MSLYKPIVVVVVVVNQLFTNLLNMFFCPLSIKSYSSIITSDNKFYLPFIDGRHQTMGGKKYHFNPCISFQEC